MTKIIQQKKGKLLERALGIFLFLCLILNSITFAEALTQESIKFTISSNKISTINTAGNNFPFESLNIKNINEKQSIVEIKTIAKPIDKFLIAKPAFQYFSIDSSSNLYLDFEFGVDKSWITNNNLDEQKITLYMYDKNNKTWTEIDSTKIYSNAGKIYYKTKTTTGYFVIASKDIQETISSSNNNLENTKTNYSNTNVLETPTLEQPLEIKSKSNKTLFSILIVITLLGIGVTTIVAKQIPKKETSKNYNINFDLIGNIEEKILQRTKNIEEIQKEIEELEPKIALKIANTLKLNGFQNNEIKEKLLSNNISEETINKILA